MPNKMLIDATHPEETRVVVLRGNRVEEFDFESANRKQLRGNIYLAKVTRVEPSLQAAFVDYGGNRHGFLAFSEIHPDYYQIPVADRQALIDEEEREQRAADVEADHRAGRGRHQGRRERSARRPRDEVKSRPVETPDEHSGGHGDDERGGEDFGVMAAGGEQMLPVGGANDEAAHADHPADASHSAESHSAESSAGESAEHTASHEPPMAATATQTPIELTSLGASSSAEPIPTAGEPLHMEIGGGAAANLNESQETDDAVTTIPSEDVVATEPSEAHRGEGDGHNVTEVNGNDAEGDEEVINRSAAPTRWRKFRSAPIARAASTRSRRSSSAGRSCWCRSSRRSAATRARRSPPTCRWPAATAC